MTFRKLSILLAGLLVSCQSMGAFTLNGTRFIYESGSKNISFEVTSHSSDTWGGQVWIENVSMPADTVTLVPAPTFFKVNGNQRQVVRVLDVNDAPLPKDRESLFRLNVQEIPPEPRKGSSVLSLAMNTRVKLIYRPASLTEGRKDAEKQLRIEQRDGVSVLVNPTPYYFAVVKLHSGDTDKGPLIQTPVQTADALSEMAPHAEVPLGKTVRLPVTVEAIDDYGAVRSHTLGK
ncbi:fimbrial chaperone protein [Salmonella enterica subsp. diarizonae]|uniref:Fimbrial chaperone protein n=1 Tax=Salmonella diarizonae TaxID=59204 RepID=A0A5Y3W9E5_SALDZ|nr:fimbrial chaperone protein [Salmonella enterica subsp. diarizonae]EBG1930935.1 fimbrial chaperone [Salmonella enterica]EBS2926440.1 fimbrial chaperone [Salmonella enterica subsp. enterica serovar Hvittingfoss]EBZ8403923.1 fimbrial chaperone [Salmonella enterica subsp. enterica serovar Muenchen]ECF1925568.1 fimbrial chaperone [Salmonella enterica subsp. enterica serovar Newport]